MVIAYDKLEETQSVGSASTDEGFSPMNDQT